MKYGLIAETPLESRWLQSAHPSRVALELLLPMIQVRSLMLASRMGVFRALRATPLTAAQAAAALPCDPEMATLVLRILWGAGYVSRNGNEYSLTDLSRACLTDFGPSSACARVAFHRLLWRALEGMDDTFVSGQGSRFHESLENSDARQTYQEAMLEDARLLAPLIVPHIPVPKGATRLVDIGGSHGLYGALLCQAHPPLRSRVLELPEAVESARRLGEREGITDFVEYAATDDDDSSFGHDIDVVLLSNVLHHMTADQCRGLLSRARRSLGPRGTIVIIEFCPADPDSRPDMLRDSLALLFRVISKGSCHPVDRYASWLREAGVRRSSVKTLPAMPQLALVIGTMLD